MVCIHKTQYDILKIKWYPTYDVMIHLIFNLEMVRVISSVVMQGSILYHNAGHGQATTVTSQSHDHGEINLYSVECTDHSTAM